MPAANLESLLQEIASTPNKFQAHAQAGVLIARPSDGDEDPKSYPVSQPLSRIPKKLSKTQQNPTCSKFVLMLLLNCVSKILTWVPHQLRCGCADGTGDNRSTLWKLSCVTLVVGICSARRSQDQLAGDRVLTA
eukprot:4924786-Amphidinium_carterae.1